MKSGCYLPGTACLLTLTFFVLMLPFNVRAEYFYVAVDGNDQMPGTEQNPFATVERAETAASPGDTIYIRGGTYRFSGTQRTVGVAFNKDGEPGLPIRYFAYPGEVPVFDLSEVTPWARVTGLDIQSDWIHIRGLEVTRVRQLIVGDSWGVRIRGNNNILESLNVHHCEAPGIFITSGGDNQIINCDSHHNYDPLERGENADGFGCHSSGGNNTFHSCRAYDNSDDGFDFINAPGTCMVEYSWSFHNGYVPDTSTPSGNGAGFKSGGFGNPPTIPSTGVPRHVVRFNLAFDNLSQGFYSNHHPGGLDFINNSAFDNSANFDMRVTGAVSTHLLRNNLAALSGVPLTNFTGGSDDFNSWTLPVIVTADDFKGLDKSQARKPRAVDGSLPSIDLLHLKDDSDLVDQGEDQGLPFAGEAPDLGAFESGMFSTTPDLVDAGYETQGEAGVTQPDSSMNGESGTSRPDTSVNENVPDSTFSDTLYKPETGATPDTETLPVVDARTLGDVEIATGEAAMTDPEPPASAAHSGASTSSCGCRLATRSSGQDVVAALLLSFFALTWRAKRRSKII